VAKKKRIKTPMDWWHSRIEDLCGAQKEIATLYNQVKESLPQSRIYQKGPWVFMKLLIVAYYIDIYTNTAKQHFSPVFYIDLFSGPGFNYIEELDEVLAGSPLLAQLMPRSGKEFDSMILFDKNSDNCATLERVMSKATIECYDCNSDIATDLITNTVKKSSRSHFLAFIDPEGLEVEWNTLESIFKLNGDLMVNYQYNGIARLVGSYHRTSGRTKISSGLRLTKFFGTEDWKNITRNSAEELFKLYLSRIKKHRSKTIVIPVPFEVGGAQYRIIIAAKETKSGSPWLNPMEQVRKRCEKMTYRQLENLVETYRKRQSTLDDFC
jgi:three-Cys-motif partner protein